jgi:hypothetical protein
MPYWLSLFADMSARSCRPDAVRAILDAARPEGCGLRSAAQIGSSPPAASDYSGAASMTVNDRGSHARLRAFSRRPSPSAWDPERCANAAVHTFGPYTGFQTTHLKETT